MSTWVQLRSTEQVRLQWRGILAAGLVAMGLFATRSAEQTRDSLVYALAAKTGVEMFHPHHLIYTPVVRLFYQGLRPLCPACDAVLAGQIHNILWAAIGILAFFFLVKSLWGMRIALAAALLFVGQRGFWELSTQTTMYAPSAAILTVLTAGLVSVQQAAAHRLRLHVAWMAALLAVAIIYHQANLLFILPLGVFLIGGWGKLGLKTWLWVVSLAGIVTLASYLAVYLTTTQSWSLAGFIHFCLEYASEICLGGLCKTSPDGWGSLTNLSAAGLSQLLSSLFWNVLVLPAQLEALALPVFGLVVLVLTGWHIVQILGRAAGWHLRLFCLAWFYTYVGFFFWWLPSYQHPFVSGMVPLTLLGVLFLRDAARRISTPQNAERAAAVGVACLALVIGGRNFQARILPLSQSPGDAYREAAALDAAAPEGCVFLTSYRTWNHLRYYFNRQTAIQAKHPLSYFYLDEPLTPDYRIADQPCVFVATTFLMPTYVNEDYTEDPIDAYQTPDRWLAYLSWLLEIETDGAGQTVSSRNFVVVHLDEGAPYLRLLPTRRGAEGLEDLFRQLDAALNAPAQPFYTWYSTAQ